MRSLINKRGFTGQILMVIVFIVLLAIGVMAWMGISLVLPLFENLGVGVLNDVITATGNNTNPSNFSEAAQESFTPLITTIKTLQTITIVFIFFLFIGFFIMLSFVRTYPFLLFIWIVGIVIISFFGLIAQDSYLDVKNQDGFTREVYSAWGFNDFLMSNLPFITVIVGVIGALLMLFVLATDSDVETGGVSNL